jgi:integral membrane protein
MKTFLELLRTERGRLRIISFTEGMSYLLLLGIAMPLKYLAGVPEATMVAGSAHGALFVLFVLALLLAMLEERWPLRHGALAMVCAMVPLGAFYFEWWLRKLPPPQDGKSTASGASGG